jgi:glycosyltransferase involved in cell wall biosynthesis
MNSVRRRVFFVNRYFYPDESATSQMLSDLAFGLAGHGVEVHVLCSRQIYTDPGADLAARERLYGVEVHRVATTRFGRARLIGRALDYASFYFSTALALSMSLRAHDLVVAKTDPPLISILAAIVARLKCAELINWQQDVFPEIATQLGANPLPRWIDAKLCRLRDWSLRAAKLNVVIGSRMLEHYRARGIPGDQLCVIENWADARAITPKAAENSSLRAELGLSREFVIGYSGNLGRGHEYGTLLAAAAALRSDQSIVFLMIGGGAKMELLRAAVADQSLENFRFLSYRPREQLADSLAAADVHLASLLPTLEGLIMPSKLYGILAAGRPLIFIGDTDGDIARVLAATDCGVTVGVNAVADLVAAIRRLQSAPTTVAAMGTRAREVLVERYSMDHAINRWMVVLNPRQEGPSDAAPPPSL